MNELERKAQQHANEVMSMNRHYRRAFAKQNKIPIKIVSTNIPYAKPKS